MPAAGAALSDSVLRFGPEDAEVGVLLMHGLGADAGDLAPVVPHLGRDDWRFVLPTAPIRPVTINGGWAMPAWYDITSMDRSDPKREVEEHIRAVSFQMETLMEDEGPSKWVVAGFSQGGAIALHLAWRCEKKLLGVLAMSTYLVLEHTLDAEKSSVNASTPAMFCHGSEDDVVPIARGRHAFDRWNDGRPCRFESYPMAHSLCLPQVRDVGQWLRSLG